MTEPIYNRVCAKIDLDALDNNISVIKSRIPSGVRLLAVVKADAYGHGALRIAGHLKDKVDAFGVASVEEGAELRCVSETKTSALPLGAGNKPILVLGYTPPQYYKTALDHDITLTVFNYDDAVLLSEVALSENKIAKVHIAVDTGMSRIGVSADEKGADIAALIYNLPNICVEGVFSHYATADAEDKSVALAQKSLFESFSELLSKRGIKPELRHISNSAAIMGMPVACNMVRAGIIMYGCTPNGNIPSKDFKFKPLMSLVAHVTNVFTLDKGKGISYGHTFIAERKMRVATVAVGYADGYLRSLSNKGSVLINGKYCKVLGRVCMDQLMVDVSEAPDTKVGSEAVLFGASDDEKLWVEQVATAAGSFNYEFVCGVSRRVPRAYFINGECKEIVSYL